MAQEGAKISTLKYEEIQRMLVIRQVELNTLLEITQAINNNLSASSIYKMYEFILRFHLHIGKLGLFVRKGKIWECESGYGLSKELRNLDVEKNLGPFQDVTEIDDEKGLLSDFELVVPVYHKSEALAYVLLGELRKYGDERKDVINFIRTISNVVLVAIENKRLFKEMIYKEKMGKELEIAGKVQSMLIPSELPKNKDIEIAANYLPHQTVGGDYYDYIKINSNEFIFCIADVSGKGMGAALLMSNFQASLRALVPQNVSLIDLVTNLNKNVLNNTGGDRFITFFIGKYNIKDRELNYINAGHNPPLLYQSEGIIELDRGCTILGIFEELPSIKFGSIKLDKNALILAYTDGLVEIQSVDGKEGHTEENLIQFMNKNHKLSAIDFNKKLIDSLAKFKESEALSDDLTLFTMRTF